MPLWKLIFQASELGHVGQVVESGLVHFQAFFTQIKTWKVSSVIDGQTCLLVFKNSRLFWRNLHVEVDFSPIFASLT